MGRRRKKKKKKNKPHSTQSHFLELDLHEYHLPEAITAFVELYNSRIGEEYLLKVIHGYGSSGVGGIIREKLRLILQQNEHLLSWTSGENFEDNPGITIVYPRLRMPEDIMSILIEQYDEEVEQDDEEIDQDDEGEESQNLARQAELEQGILDFCAEFPRAQSKIDGKFRRYGIPAVKESLKNLLGQKKLEITKKNNRKHYLSVSGE